MKAYSNIINNKKDLKNSEKKSRGIFCLPLYPELKNSEILKIIKTLKKPTELPRQLRWFIIYLNN